MGNVDRCARGRSEAGARQERPAGRVAWQRAEARRGWLAASGVMDPDPDQGPFKARTNCSNFPIRPDGKRVEPRFTLRTVHPHTRLPPHSLHPPPYTHTLLHHPRTHTHRVRKLYEKYLEWRPSNVGAWVRFADLERQLGETGRWGRRLEEWGRAGGVGAAGWFGGGGCPVGGGGWWGRGELGWWRLEE